MIILDTTTKSLEAVLAGAITTNQLPIVTSYVDVTTTTYAPASNDTVTNGITAVTIVAAPAASVQRQVKLVTVHNADTVAATLTIRLNNAATTRILCKITLAVGDTLVYTDGEGFRVIDSDGNIQQGPTIDTFGTIAVSGQSNVVADSPTDTLTLAAGSNITLTTNATTDTVTIASTGGAPGGLDTHVQFNDASAFGGDAGLTYNKTTDALTLAGPLIISGAAAGQIAFPATQNASAGANTLDDYEEGTWTPVIGGSGGTSGQAYARQNGRYVKIGQLVWAGFWVTLLTEGTITGEVRITGLPFSSSADEFPAFPLGYSSMATSWVNIIAQIQTNSTFAAVVGAAAAATSNQTTLTAADINDTTDFKGAFVYRTNA